MENELLKILTDEPKDAAKIEDWFDRIAKELLLHSVLQVNDIELEFNEIEFYFFKFNFHEDVFTHKHKRAAGEWRFHNSGLDITIRGDDVQDGGILIRGVKNISKESNPIYVNGPIKVLTHVGQCWNNAVTENCLKVIPKELKLKEILKTPRHLPNKAEWEGKENYQNKNYRYITELGDNENLKHIKRENCIPL